MSHQVVETTSEGELIGAHADPLISTFAGPTAGSGIAIGEGAHVQIQYYQPVVQQVFSNLSEEELQEAYRKLLAQIEQYFDIVAETLYDNNYLQQESLEHLQKAKEILQNREQDGDLEWVLSRAQFEVRRVHVAISKEQQIQRGEKRLSWVVPAIVVAYIAAIVAIIAFAGQAWTRATEVPIIGVPVSILLWAAIGSLSAILYRFYTRRRGRVTREIRWLIARPVIGVVMGALSYLAVVSGLFIFGAATGAAEPDTTTARPQLLWMLAFLGGFSDKVFNTIVNAIISKLSGPESDQPSSESVQQQDV
jgi:hypothetical protein